MTMTKWISVALPGHKTDIWNLMRDAALKQFFGGRLYPPQSVKQLMQSLVDVSQSRTVRSSPQEAMILPSGENLQEGENT